MTLTNLETGPGWELRLGDSCDELPGLPAESIDLSVYSPPFRSLFTYTDSERDIGNCHSTAEFLEHYAYVVREVHRVTKPGRMSCVHVADVATTKTTDGVIGLYDLAGDVIRLHQDAGWIFHGRVTVDKDPQAQAIRTKSHALLFVTKNRDSLGSRPAIPDYLLIFRKPGDAATPVATDVTNEEWIDWARPVWLDIRESNTLNERVARDDADEKHLCPLQLDFIDRCIRLWSNPGETVLTPFAGIGSEVYEAVKHGRRGLGIELKPSYWRTAVANLRDLDNQRKQDVLFGEA